MKPTRRRFVKRSAAISLGAFAPASLLAQESPRARPPKRTKPGTKKIAIVTTVYDYLSHAYHICGRFLEGYLRDGKFHFPNFEIAGMYVAQRPKGDLSGDMARRHGFTLYPSIESALTLGGNKLAVDGVLLIGEHGAYPYNRKFQKLYPRFEFFQQVVEVFKKSRRSVPVFCDKHLSYDRRHGQQMVETARKMSFGLMAGSSLPVTWRRPELELPIGSPIEEALVVSRGELEVFGIHSLEALQCMVERRAKEETGVRSVRGLQGDAVWKAADEGVWSAELLEHALGRSESLNVGAMRENCRHYTTPFARPAGYPPGPFAFQIEYRDGLKATVLTLNGHVDDTTFAARLKGQAKPVSTLFYLPPPPGARFLEALTTHIETFLKTGKPQIPVERTQLTGGILDYALDSRMQAGKWLATPDLDIRYQPPADSGFMRGPATHAMEQEH